MAKRRPANPKRPTDATIRIPCFSLPGTYPFYSNFCAHFEKINFSSAGTGKGLKISNSIINYPYSNSTVEFQLHNLKWPQKLNFNHLLSIEITLNSLK